MKHLTIIILLCFLYISTYAQTGEIQGKIKDMELSGEGLPFANVYVTVDGVPTGTSSDMDGFYSIKSLPPGTYELAVEYIGYETMKVENIFVYENTSVCIDVGIRPFYGLGGFLIMCYWNPLIYHDKLPGFTTKRQDI